MLLIEQTPGRLACHLKGWLVLLLGLHVTASSDGQMFYTKPETLVSVQALRALAALAVMVFHLKPYFAIKFGIRDPFPSCLLIGAAGVDVFFVLSGFIITLSSEKLFSRPGSSLEFLARRCIRIIPLYWAISLVLLCDLLFMHGLFALDLPAIASFAFIPIPRSNGLLYPLLVAGWTLNYEMYFYVIFSLAIIFRRNVAIMCVSAFLIATVTLSTVLGHLPQPFAFWSSPLVLEFVAGMILAWAYSSRINLTARVSIPLIGIGLIAFALSLYGLDRLPRFIAWGLPATLVVAGTALGPKPNASRTTWKVLILLGDASYSLYLVYPLGFAVPHWFFPELIDPSIMPLTYASLMMLIAVGVSIAVHLFIEKPIRLALTRFWCRRFETPRGENALRSPRSDQHRRPSHFLFSGTLGTFSPFQTNRFRKSRIRLKTSIQRLCTRNSCTSSGITVSS